MTNIRQVLENIRKEKREDRGTEPFPIASKERAKAMPSEHWRIQKII
jgi:hypothetical protein